MPIAPPPRIASSIGDVDPFANRSVPIPARLTKLISMMSLISDSIIDPIAQPSTAALLFLFSASIPVMNPENSPSKKVRMNPIKNPITTPTTGTIDISAEITTPNKLRTSVRIKYDTVPSIVAFHHFIQGKTDSI